MISPSAVAGSQLIGGFFGKFLFSIFALFMFINFVATVSQTHNVQEALFNTGKDFFLSSQEIITESNNIIANGGVYDPSLGIMAMLWIYAKLIYLILSILVGIKIIAFIISLSPWGKSDNFFQNYSLAILFIFILEILFLLIYHGAIVKDMNGLTGPNGAFYYISLPITSLVQLFNALNFAFSPAIDRINQLNISNSA